MESQRAVPSLWSPYYCCPDVKVHPQYVTFTVRRLGDCWMLDMIATSGVTIAAGAEA